MLFKNIHWFLKLVLIFLLLFIVWIFISRVLPKLLPTRELTNGEVWGLIFSNQVWSGTINITGDVWAMPGVTVTVKPGSKIVINKDGDKFNMDYLPWHLKSGKNTGEDYRGVSNGELFWDERQKIQVHFSKLDAIGAPGAPITITSNSSPNDLSPYDINVISFDQGILANVYASNFRRLEVGADTTVRESHFKNVAECAVCIDGGAPSVINNTFESSLREYIWVDQADPRITDNVFQQDSPTGIRISPGDFGKPVISHNDFNMSGKMALEFLNGNEELGSQIFYNNFVSDSIIKIPCDSHVRFFYNNLLSKINFRTINCDNLYKFGPNYWELSSSQDIISERVMNDAANLRLVIDAPLRDKIKIAGPRI